MIRRCSEAAYLPVLLPTDSASSLPLSSILSAFASKSLMDLLSPPAFLPLLSLIHRYKFYSAVHQNPERLLLHIKEGRLVTVVLYPCWTHELEPKSENDAPPRSRPGTSWDKLQVGTSQPLFPSLYRESTQGHRVVRNEVWLLAAVGTWAGQ